MRKVCAIMMALACGLAPVWGVELTTATEQQQTVPGYLIDPVLPEEMRAKVAVGQLAEVEEWLESAIKDAVGGAQEDFVIARERMRRLRRDFSLTDAELLEKVKTPIPDVTADLVTKWREAGHLQWIPVDGERRYFRREPANLFRLSAEARDLRDAARKRGDGPAGDPAADMQSSVTLPAHAAEALAEAARLERSEVLPVRFKVRHRITVPADKVPAGEDIRCWMPYPQEYRQQRDVALVRTEPAEHEIAPNGVPMRTIYFTKTAEAGTSTVFEAEYEYTNSAFVTRENGEAAPGLDHQASLAPYLAPQPPNIIVDDRVRQLAAEIVGDEKEPFEQARLLWRWMQDHIKYCSEMEYSIMPSATEKILEERRGDCGVQALLYISLCRSLGIPARWQSGWVTRPGRWNMHDWSEIYIESRGWLPVDPSIGYMDSSDLAVKEFLFANMDSYRMIANLGSDDSFVPPKTHWRSDPVDNQRGEVEWSGGNLYYDDFRYEVQVTSEPLAAPAP